MNTLFFAPPAIAHTLYPRPLTQRRVRSLLSWKTVLTSVGVGLLPATWITLARPVMAAERIYATYGILEISVSVDSLEIFADKGKIKGDLSAFTRYATPEQLIELQSFLSTRAPVNQVAVAQFLYTPQGEALLRRAGEIIQTESRQSGFYAIRAALILAAADPEIGLTPINVLRHFPLAGIRVDVERTLEIAQQLEQLISQTNRAIATIEQLSALEAASEPTVDFTTMADLRVAGPFTGHKHTIHLSDVSRDRNFRADIYLPTAADGSFPKQAPVIVISHGLGSDRTTYAYLAEHLASYGFAVAVPDHPGSNAEQLQALIEGRASEVADPQEFIDRPLDVKFLLDSLEVDRDSQFKDRLDLQNVGVIGQSFGGYTALVLAGAKINVSALQTNCPDESLNLSLLLQCRALALTNVPSDFRDDRIKAVIAINPIGSSLLGEAGFRDIQIPVMLVTGDADTVAPSLLEQIYPFTWLNASHRYLLLLRGATHFSTIGESDSDSGSVQLPPEIIGPDPAIARRYLNAMSVSFFEIFVTKQMSYLAYLGSGYARFISQNPMQLRLVSSLSPTQLSDSLTNPSDSANLSDISIPTNISIPNDISLQNRSDLRTPPGNAQ
jgi:predicted dienelactone hydrolase